MLWQVAEELSRTPLDSTRLQTRRAFIDAAEAFDNLAVKSRKWKHKAAEGFGKGGSHMKAAERFASVGWYEKAIFHFWEAKAVDEASKIFCEQRETLTAEFAEKYEGRLRKHYVRLGDFK